MGPVPLSKGNFRPSGFVAAKEDIRMDGLTMAKEWIGKVAVTSNWDIKDDGLKTVPLDFLLERTHKEIHGCGACEVACRISDALRDLSIEAEFDDERAKAKCCTRDFVSFRIRLFASGEGGTPVIVEVQKRSGQTMSFMQSCRAILSAAEGLKVAEQPQKKGPPSTFKLPIGEMQCLKGVPPVVITNEDVRSYLEKSIELMRSDKRDANLLGIENLCLLTDPLKTALSTASRVSFYVVIGDDKCNIRDEIEVLSQRSAETSAFMQSPMEEGVDYFQQIHHHILRLFSNALLLTAQSGLLHDAVQSQSWFRGHLVPTLLDEIKNAALCPNNSHVAAKCLHSLMCSDVACDEVLALDGLVTLRSARVFGHRRHEQLATESDRCVKALERRL